MTSLQLVEYVNSYRKEKALEEGVPFPSKGHAKLEHSDFMKKVPEVLGGGSGIFSDTYQHDQNGQIYQCYKFPKREACLMAMSYSYELQAKVFDYMTELEMKQQEIQMYGMVVPKSYGEALIALGNKQVTIEHQQQQLALAAPKVDFVNKYVERDVTKNLTSVAKEMEISAKALGAWLRDEGHAFKSKDKLVWTKPFIDSGYGVHKHFSTEKKAGSQALITPDGDLFIKKTYKS